MPGRRLLSWCLIAAIALAIGCLSDCGPSLSKAVVAVVTPAKTVDLEAPAPKTANAIRAELDQNAVERAKLMARDAFLEEALVKTDRAAVARELLWVALLAIAGFGVCVAGFFWAPLPVLKRIAAYGGTAFIAVALLALGVREALPWLRWALMAIFALGGLAAVVLGLPYLRHLVELAHQHGDLLPAGRLRDALDRIKLKTKPPKARP